MFQKERTKEVILYLGGILLCSIILILSRKLWKEDLTSPAEYYGDALWLYTTIKTMVDTGWFLSNPYLGAPYGFQIYDFPQVEFLNQFILWILARFSDNPFLIGNIFLLLLYPLITCTTIWALRILNISRIWSLAGGILYAYLRYHTVREGGHLFLASYFMVPPVLAILLKESFFTISKTENETNRIPTVLKIIILSLGASTGIYYSFFFCIIIFLIGILIFLRMQLRTDRLKNLFLSLCIILIASLVNLTPSLHFWIQEGSGSKVIRSFKNSEESMMKISHLMLPSRPHTISPIGRISEKYFSNSVNINENEFSYLGFWGVIGFLLTIFTALGWKNKIIQKNQELLPVARLNIAIVLFATIGGLGSLYLMILPSLRSLNRLSIFVGFFSLFFLLRIVQRLLIKSSNYVRYIVFTVVVLWGVVDQIHPAYYRSFSSNHFAAEKDKMTVSKIEKIAGKQTMIYLLPFIHFPEGAGLASLGSYDYFKYYLHSKSIKWSFGTFFGRKGYLEEIEMKKLNVKDLAQALKKKGFDWVLLTGKGYDDQGKKKIEEFVKAGYKYNLINSEDTIFLISLN